MKLTQVFSVVGVILTFAGEVLAQGQLAKEGTIVDWQPPVMRVQSATGLEAVAFVRPPIITITAPAKLDDLPASFPCYVSGRVSTKTKEFPADQPVRVTVPIADAALPTAPQAIGSPGSQDVELRNVPGMLKKGPPATLLVGRGVNEVGGKSFKMPEQFQLEYFFGANTSMIGAAAKVKVYFDPTTPDQLTLVIERTESLDASILTGGKKPKKK